MSDLQRQCKAVVERHFGLAIDNAWPPFLKTRDSQKGLELDLYYPHLGFAIECQGEQHRRHIPYFHETEEDFRKQLERDELKRKLCEDNWVIMLEVWFDEDPEKAITGFLRANMFI